ncbi:hypothetical protein PAHAL_7G054200 [Panicum hallii]|uniref:UBN2 domain-containing protein n=1 Tax=Panicum hallii TaxID=206008 RepID=A0A2T8IB55_9POAL|nr:hypothetical protein PAHAL_7G054200 [Panicum hallii]
MKMYLYGLHPSLWTIVAVGVDINANPPHTKEQEHDFFRNAQAVMVFRSSLSSYEYNKIRGLEIAKDIWDTLQLSHEGTDVVKEGKMDVLQGELESFVMKKDESLKEMHDRLKLLVTEIRMLGSKDWDEHKVTKKMLRAYAPKNPMLATMIRDKRKFKHMLPMELFNKLQFHEMNNLDVSKSIEQSEVKTIALKAKPSKKNESKEKTSKSKKKEDSSDNDSTDEETAMMVKNFKKFMKRRGDKKPVHQRRCYECGEKENDKEDNKSKDKYNDKEKKYKEKSKEYKKKHGNAHVGEGWESSDDSDKEEIATLAIQAPTPTQRLFNNYSESDDEFAIFLMAQGTKVLNASAPPSSTPSTSSDIEDNLDEEEVELERNMINEFGKKGYKKIKKLMEKLEKRKETLERQEDLLILERKETLPLRKL